MKETSSWCFPQFLRRRLRKIKDSPPDSPVRVATITNNNSTPVLSPYPTLPAIGKNTPPPPPPPLIRQATYVVPEPKIVKGPLDKIKTRNQVKNTSGGTFFTVSLDKEDNEKKLNHSYNKNSPIWTIDGNIKMKSNSQAYWLQC